MTTELLGQYGPLGAVAVILAGVIAAMVRQRWANGRHRVWDGIDRRTANPEVAMVKAELGELKSDVKEVRRSVHDIRDRLLQPLVTTVAVLEHRVGDLERRDISGR